MQVSFCEIACRPISLGILSACMAYLNGVMGICLLCKEFGGYPTHQGM